METASKFTGRRAHGGLRRSKVVGERRGGFRSSQVRALYFLTPFSFTYVISQVCGGQGRVEYHRVGVSRSLCEKFSLLIAPTRTVLASAGNDGRIRLWKATTGSIWRPAGYITVEQAEEQQKEGDVEMDDGNPAE
jgi:hypothetical protein